MFWLPVASPGDQEIRLPIPAEQSVLLANVLLSRSDPAALESCLQNSPALLLWMSAVVTKQGGTSNDKTEIETFAKSNLAKCLLEGDKYEPAEPTQDLVKACSRQSTTNNLAVILQSATDLDQKQAAQWIKEHVCARYIISQPSADKTINHAIDIAQLCETVTKLDRLTNEFEQSLQHEKLLAVKRLAYGASHEINNPLANISARAESLLAGESKPDRRQRLAMISQQAYRAHEMISDLMLFANPPNLKQEMVDVAKTVESTVHELKTLADQKRIQLNINPQTESGIEFHTLADATQLGSAIKGIIQNSIEAVGEAAQIECVLETDTDKSIIVRVLDNGPGIPDKTLPIVFDPFYSGREAGRGLGFGLAKAWRIIQLHQGSIEILPNQPGGTQVIVKIPRLQSK